VLSDPGYAWPWPELRTQVGTSVRKWIEDSTPERERFVCRVDLDALRDETIPGKKGS
jgi:hypothetical protein